MHLSPVAQGQEFLSHLPIRSRVHVPFSIRLNGNELPRGKESYYEELLSGPARSHLQ